MQNDGSLSMFSGRGRAPHDFLPQQHHHHRNIGAGVAAHGLSLRKNSPLGLSLSCAVSSSSMLVTIAAALPQMPSRKMESKAARRACCDGLHPFPLGRTFVCCKQGRGRRKGGIAQENAEVSSPLCVVGGAAL